MIIINNENLNIIKDYVRKAYPNECCGLLAGRETGIKKVVIEVHPLTNLNKDRANDRYEIDPVEYMEVDRAVAMKKLSIIGIYHSHPDHPSRPSEFDASRAWEGYSYIIVAIANGEEFEVKSWIFNESTKTFEEEKIENG